MPVLEICNLISFLCVCECVSENKGARQKIDDCQINIVHKCHSWYEDTYMVVLVPVTGLTSACSAQITLRSPGIR